MGIFSGIGSAFRFLADGLDPNAKRDPSNPMYWADMGTWSVAGVRVDEPRVSQLGAVQAVRYGISSAIGSLPFMVFRKGAKGARTAVPNHPLARLLGRRPNDRNTPAEFFGEIAWHLSYWRNAYLVIGPGDDPNAPDYAIGSLEIIHPRRLKRVERRADGYIYYSFAPPLSIVQGAALKPVEYREDKIWHLRGNPLTEDGLLGQPIWETAREVFGRAIAVHEYGNIWFHNSGQTGGIIEHPGNFKDKTDEEAFIERWRQASAGNNRHRDRLLKYGMKYSALKVTNAEAQLLETEKQSDIDIFGLWSFPPHRAGRLDRATFSNIEQQGLEFVTYGLAPLAVAIEQAAQRDLLLDNDNGKLFVEFNFGALLRGDLRSRYAAYLIGRQGEWLSANDVLRLENMSPRTDEGGDDYKNPITKNSAGGSDSADSAGEDGDGSDNEQTGTPNKDGNNGKGKDAAENADGDRGDLVD